jgi:spore coat polysaccharide biosynthesis protein SpsF
MGSNRLPGKVLLPLLDQPMLGRVVTRVKQARLIDDIVIATTKHSQDDAIVSLCNQHGWKVYRGAEDDVLDRYYQAAVTYRADHIIRITSDCPLIDPHVIDYVVAAYHSALPHVDYAANTLTRTYPRGLDVEIFSFEALKRAWHEDTAAEWREHVTPYLYRHPELFRTLQIINPADYSEFRLTVDTPQDFTLVEQIYKHFGHGDFSWQSVIELLVKRPDLRSLNREIQQKQLL